MSLHDFSGGDDNTIDDNTGSGGGIAQIVSAINKATQDDDTEITDMLVNYNEKFQTAGPTLFRDAVVQQTLSVLIRKLKPNPLLVGLAGTGKTKIVEDIAYRIANNDPLVPDQLKDKIIYELPLGALIADASFVGQLEGRVTNVVNFASDPNNHAILFIDEIHLLARRDQVYSKISQILKPALSRGDLRVIGATTSQEKSDFIDDPALNRRFQTLMVDELSREQTVTILESSWKGMVSHYGPNITADHDTFVATAAIADQYSQAGLHRPDNALTLLDQAIADSIVNHNALITQAQQQGNTAVLNALQANPSIPLSTKTIKQTALRLMTGHAVKDKLDSDALTEALSVIQGQDTAVEKVINMLKRDALDLYPRVKPLTILFDGPSGVGKTAVAKIVAEQLTQCPPIIINMTEYNSPASVNRIIGSPAGYVGSDSHAELPFDVLETNPYQVILLDELEKADKAVQRLFMSAMDEGYITTARGKKIDFTKTILFATTNAGHSAGSHAPIGFNNDANEEAKADISYLSNWFDVEFLNRFKAILSFNPISKEIYRSIAKARYEADITDIKSRNTRVTLPDTIDDDVLDEIVDATYEPSFGARPIEKAIRDYIEDSML